MNEINQIYKKQCERAYEENNFCKLRYEKQMDFLFAKLKDDFVENNLNILDACCGYGRLIHFLNQFNSEQNYHGIDYSPLLIKEGKEKFKNFKNVSFEENDIFDLPTEYQKKFDITINYKTLSWLPYYDECIKELMRVTKKKIYITSLFNDGDYDSITKVFENATMNDNDYTFLNTYSLPKFTEYCMKLGAVSVESQNMRLDIDLEKASDCNQICTYTEKLFDNTRLEITGNTLLNWKLVTITL